MRAMVYSEPGLETPLREVEQPLPEPAAGEVRVRIVVSGVNPTDWKSRANTDPGGDNTPNQDGSGVVDALGAGVTGLRVGDRVWLWLAAYQRMGGTAAEYLVLPAEQAVPLGGKGFDLGAALGVPAMTAHRALTTREHGPARLAPGALDGVTVLVTGGAGAVGNAAIQLARWAGATVITTISTDEKAALARAAGAHHVLNYRTDDVAARVHELVPDGVDLVVDVSVVQNLDTDLEVLRVGGTVVVYADDAGATLEVPVRAGMGKNLRLQFVLAYTFDETQKADAVAAIRAAIADDAIGVGEQHGLPLTWFDLGDTDAAHRAVNEGTVGKVLIRVGDSPAD